MPIGPRISTAPRRCWLASNLNKSSFEWEPCRCPPPLRMPACRDEPSCRFARPRTAGGAPRLDGKGEGTGPSEPVRSALALAMPVEELSSRTAGAYFTGLLAARLGRRIVVDAERGRFRLGLALVG